MSISDKREFSTDKPISDIKEDKLNRSLFTKELSDAIIEFSKSSSDPLVIGLSGEWGYGKTSILSMLKYYFDENHEKEMDLRIFEFNPWCYASENQLIKLFFNSLIENTDLKLGNQLKVYVKNIFDFQIELPRNLKVYIGRFIEFINKFFSLLLNHAKAFFNKKLGLNFKTEQKESHESHEIIKLKDRINKRLEEYKIFCIIDDIDRLSDKEIMDIFKLIKNVANFKNIVYILSFDKNIVSNALNRLQNSKGEEYINKIINVPIDIPAITKLELTEIFYNELNKILNNLENHNFDRNRFWDIFNANNKGIINLIKNIRDVSRYFNIFNFNFSLVKNEVDISDFLAITSIQVFSNEIYHKIKNNKDLFTKYYFDDDGIKDIIENFNSTSTYEDLRDKNKNNIENLIFSSIDEDLRNILEKIFPILSNFDNSPTGIPIDKWEKELRICHKSHFETYFKLNISVKEISEDEIKSFLVDINNTEVFRQKVFNLSEENKIKSFWNAVVNRTDQINLNNSPEKLFLMLFDLELEFYKNFDHLYSPIEKLINKLIIKLDDSNRFNVLKNTFENSNNLSLNLRVFENIKKNNDNLNSNEEGLPTLFSNGELLSLKKLMLNKFQEFSKSLKLKDSNNLEYVLYKWGEYEGLENPKLFVKKLIETDEGLISFLKSFLKLYIAKNKNDEQLRICIKNISNLTDIDEISNKIKAIKYDENDKEISELIDTFNMGYELIKRE